VIIVQSQSCEHGGRFADRGTTMFGSQDVSTTGRATAPAVLGENPFAPELIADPYPFYARLRAAGPTYFQPASTWIVSRYADVQLVLRDPRFGRFSGGQREEVLGAGPLVESFNRWMLFQNPPDHTRLRALVTRAFTPRAVEALRGEIQRIVDELLDRVQGARAMDLIADVAYPLPVLVICALLGVPTEDRDRFHGWSAGLARSLDAFGTPEPDIIARGNEAAAASTAYFRELVGARGKARDDLLSGLIASEEQGDKLSEDELLATCVLLFFAGHETTVNLIGNGMLALLRHPDQLARLRADPSLIQSAVEELLRYDGPVQRTGRLGLEDAEVGGQRVQAGESVTAFLGAANRDPVQFADPDRLDVARSNNHHLAFGGGIHYCVGASLARLEAQIAINTLLHRLPGLRLQTAVVAWRQTAVLRGLQALPVAAY